MRLLDLFRQAPSGSATSAKQRLQAVIVLERDSASAPDFLPMLRYELLQVIGKYVPIDPDAVKLAFERKERVSMLEVNVELPAGYARESAI